MRRARKTETKAMENRTHQTHEQVAKSLEYSRSTSVDKAKTQYGVGMERGKASLDVSAIRSYVATNEPENNVPVTETWLYSTRK